MKTITQKKKKKTQYSHTQRNRHKNYCVLIISLNPNYDSTVSILLVRNVRKANAKGSVSGFEIAPPSKGGGSDKHLALN